MNPEPSFFDPMQTSSKKGFNDDARKIPLEIFLHVNTLTDFQRHVIPDFLDTKADVATVGAALHKIAKQVEMLQAANWKPNKANGDAVVQPDHYARFPIEPTFFNMENGIDWCRGNALKYICRFPFKNGIEDLRKAMRYLAMWIRYTEGEAGWSK